MDIDTCAPCAVGPLPAKGRCSSITLPIFWHYFPGFVLGEEEITLFGQVMLWASSPGPRSINCEGAVRPPGLGAGFGAQEPQRCRSGSSSCALPGAPWGCWSKPCRGRAEPLFSISAAVWEGRICVTDVTHGNHLWSRRSCWLGRGSGAEMGSRAVRGEPGEAGEGSIPSSSSLGAPAAPAGAGAAGGVGEPAGSPRSWIIYGQRQQLTVTLFAICL